MVSDELHYLTLLEAGQKISGGEVSSLELTETMLARIEKLNASLHPYGRTGRPPTPSWRVAKYAGQCMVYQ